DYGIFITNIIPGGVADKNGKLKVGDPTVYSLNTQLQSANTSIQNQLISRNETNGPRLTTNDEQEEFSL
ncbi:unnamed protein product, partial [Rotaria sordida]